jgi:hypothetical protein
MVGWGNWRRVGRGEIGRWNDRTMGRGNDGTIERWDENPAVCEAHAGALSDSKMERWIQVIGLEQRVRGKVFFNTRLPNFQRVSTTA